MRLPPLRAFALAALAVAAAPHPLQAAEAAESPFIAMLRKADVAGTGYVTRRSVDAPLAEVQKRQADEARGTWRRLASLTRTPDGGEISPTALSGALSAALREADTDGNGSVDAVETRAFLERERDATRREALTFALRSLDADGDGTVSAEEAARVAEVGKGETLTLARIVENTDTLNAWQGQAMDTLFARFADADGKVSIEEVSARLKAASANAKEGRD